MAWIRVTKSTPCLICGRPDWCRILDELDKDGNSVVQCTRVPSPKEIKTKGGDFVGFLHLVQTGPAQPRPVLPKPVKEAPSLTTDQLTELHQLCLASLDEAKLERFAGELGLSVSSLKRLGVGWHPRKFCWTFPMVGQRGVLVGLRTRLPTGEKRAITGSHNGLFVPTGLTGEGPLLIEEGPTSTAALLDMGLDAVGRPFVPGGVELLRKFVKGMRRLVVVVANNDPVKTRPDGSKWWPGQEGGMALAKLLAGDGLPCKMVLPLKYKDSRDLKKSGATYQTVMSIIKNTGFAERDK